MIIHRISRALGTAFALLAFSGAAQPQSPATQERILVAVTVPDIEPLVRAVGGNRVETFSLLKGCLIRKDLDVEPGAQARLAKADAIVWTGFLSESAAVSSALRNVRTGPEPAWINISRGAARTNLPVSTCFGYVDANFASGDPFYWLNPMNGGIIAQNIAKGLGAVRPADRMAFAENARAIQASLDLAIARWKAALKPLEGLKVFSAQCGWQNFSPMGGPAFVVCKNSPGELPAPKLLVGHVLRMKADLVLVDPRTPLEYAETFRGTPGLKVVEAASSIEDIPGATRYEDLFDHFIRTLIKAAGPGA